MLICIMWVAHKQKQNKTVRAISFKIDKKTHELDSCVNKLIKFNILISVVCYCQDIAESSKGNIVISPFSISSAVAFLSQGANGTTFEQIANALHLPNDKKVVADLFHEFSNQFEKSEETSTLTVANRIFVTNRYKINSTFNDIAESKFHAGAETVDFLQNVETANKINGWVEQKTNEKIKDLVKANDLKPETGLVLANAIYFSGAWANEFDETDTKPGKFHLNSNDKTDVEYMHLTEYFGYVELADLDAVACKFPYNDGRMSMIVILPNQITGLAELELKMKDYDMSRIFDEMHRVKVDVTLPKFKFEFESNLNDTLQKVKICTSRKYSSYSFGLIYFFSLIQLGMSEMFDESKADLSGLLETAKRLKVSQVVHKAFIDVNEKGTEAAAATCEYRFYIL